MSAKHSESKIHIHKQTCIVDCSVQDLGRKAYRTQQDYNLNAYLNFGKWRKK